MENLNPNPYTEHKVLNTAACQGQFIIDNSANHAEEKQDVATSLAKSGYLKHISINKGIVTYKITEKGKVYLKGLKGQTPKHNHFEDKNSNTLSLEYILTKRLRILKSANNRGLEFNLTDANVKALLTTKTCYYTGFIFDSDDDPLDVRTFERVDDTKGYVKGNVVAVTLRANRIKNLLMESDNNDLYVGVESFINMAEMIKKHLY